MVSTKREPGVSQDFVTNFNPIKMVDGADVEVVQL